MSTNNENNAAAVADEHPGRGRRAVRRSRAGHALTALTLAPLLTLGVVAAGVVEPAATAGAGTGHARELASPGDGSVQVSSAAAAALAAREQVRASRSEPRHAFRDRGVDVSSAGLEEDIVEAGMPIQEPADGGVELVAAATPSRVAVPLGTRAVREAAAQRGKPYRFGAAGPRAFDCSGLVHYVYDSKLRQHLPRTANAQRKVTVRVAKNRVRPGDLIFFMRSGRAYHVGIYAGGGRVWHAPMPGKRVENVRIWTSAWVAGRV